MPIFTILSLNLPIRAARKNSGFETTFRKSKRKTADGAVLKEIFIKAGRETLISCPAFINVFFPNPS